MIILIRELSRNEVKDLYGLMKTDFPKDELRPLPMMLSAMEAGNYKGFGLFIEDELKGYSFLFKLDDFYLLDYFAIVKEYRNAGLGSSFLKELLGQMETFNSIIGEVENEAFAQDVKDKATRIRRTEFYYRNGFVDTTARTLLFGVHFKIIEYSRSLHSKEEIEKVYLEFYRVMLPEKIFAKNVKIE